TGGVRVGILARQVLVAAVKTSAVAAAAVGISAAHRIPDAPAVATRAAEAAAVIRVGAAEEISRLTAVAETSYRTRAFVCVSESARISSVILAAVNGWSLQERRLERRGSCAARSGIAWV